MATDTTPNYMVVTLDKGVIADLAAAVVDELERREKARDAALIASHEGNYPTLESVAQLARQLAAAPLHCAATCSACGASVPFDTYRAQTARMIVDGIPPSDVRPVVLCTSCAAPAGGDAETGPR